MRCPVVHHVVACSSYVQAVWDCLRGLWASSEKRGARPVGQARIQHIVYCCLAIWCCVCLELDGPGLGSNRQRIFAPVVESSGMTGLDRFVHAERDTACLYADCDTTSYCTYVCTCIASLQADVFEVRGDLLTLHRGFIGLLCDLVVFNASSCCHC